MTGKMADIDPFDYETWPVLSDMRKDLRERIFDEEDPQKVSSLQVELDDVEIMIKEGMSRYIPF
jgi:hypothetical protein